VNALCRFRQGFQTLRTPHRQPPFLQKIAEGSESGSAVLAPAPAPAPTALHGLPSHRPRRVPERDRKQPLLSLISSLQVPIPTRLHPLGFARHLRSAYRLQAMLKWVNAGRFLQPCEELPGEYSPLSYRMKTTAVHRDSPVGPTRAVVHLLKRTLQCKQMGTYNDRFCCRNF
jgi:hypothetical protein